MSHEYEPPATPEPKGHTESAPPTTPGTARNAGEKPPGVLGQVVTVAVAVVLGLAALAWSVGPYLAPDFFARLTEAVVSHLWLYWVGLPVFAVLVLLGGALWSALRKKK
jgi:hypothetical protein